MRSTFFVATSNPGKLRDFALVSEGTVTIVPLADLAAIPAPEETELTFEGNARLKATYYSAFAPGELVIADDSGLEVDALDGAPGVRSARYAEDLDFSAGSEMPVDERNNACLMEQMRDVPEARRAARYRCVLAAARNGHVIAIGNGVVEGRVLRSARGRGGFGYDPYFAPEGRAESMAELDCALRLQLSHRGRALCDLLARLGQAAI